MLNYLKAHLEFAISLLLLVGLAAAELIQHARSKPLPQELLLWLILAFLANLTRELTHPTRNKNIVELLRGLQKDSRDIKSALVPELWDRVERSGSLLDPNIAKLISAQDLLESLRGIFHDNVFEISDSILFKSLYKKTLEIYGEASFMATSIPRLDFFWGDEDMNRAIRNFLEGGKMKRIFFLKSADEINEEEPRRIMLRQTQMGVDVYTIVASQAPYHLQQLFIVDSEERIAWELVGGPERDATIRRAILHWKEEGNDDHLVRGKHKSPQSFQKIFNQLLALPNTRKFVETDMPSRTVE